MGRREVVNVAKVTLSTSSVLEVAGTSYLVGSERPADSPQLAHQFPLWMDPDGMSGTGSDGMAVLPVDERGGESAVRQAIIRTPRPS
eukprot:COSAG06_NODE_26779_length_607_cov_1.513780_1_plen_86_part_01